MRQITSDPIVGSDSSENMTIEETAVVYTKAFKIGFGDYFSLDYKAASATGTADVKIELEQSVGDAVPTTEGSLDLNYVESVSDIETSLSDEVWHKKAITPPVSKYARLKITGVGSNPTDTIFNAKINQRQEM